jgi:hypothetical protein
MELRFIFCLFFFCPGRTLPHKTFLYAKKKMSQCSAEVVDKKTELLRHCKNTATTRSPYCVTHTEMYGKECDTDVAAATSSPSSSKSSERGSNNSNERVLSKSSERVLSKSSERKTPRSLDTTPGTAGFDALPSDV